MPIHRRIAPFFASGCPNAIYAVLVRISPGYPPAMGKLHTCYSPVRRSPALQPRLKPAAPRLACVKPVASVHPEPGSNSPLLFIFFLFSFSFGFQPKQPSFPVQDVRIKFYRNVTEFTLLPNVSLFSCTTSSLCNSFNVLFFASLRGLPLKRECKVTNFF